MEKKTAMEIVGGIAVLAMLVWVLMHFLKQDPVNY